MTVTSLPVPVLSTILYYELLLLINAGNGDSSINLLISETKLMTKIINYLGKPLLPQVMFYTLYFLLSNNPSTTSELGLIILH